MTILQIKTAVANYFEKTVADLTVNGQDLGLLALNQVMRQAELSHDFEFQRKLVTVSVDGVTGGSLEDAVLYSDGVTPVDIKTVLDVGVFDANGNLHPVEWTTVSEGLERQRGENRFGYPVYPAEDELGADVNDTAVRYVISGTQIFRFPKNADSDDVTLGLEVYAFTDELVTTGIATAVFDLNTSNIGITTGRSFELVGLYNDFPLYALTGVNPCYVAYYDGSNWILVRGDRLGDNTASAYYSAPNVDVDIPVTGWIGFGSYTGTFYFTRVAASGGSAFSSEWTTYAAQYLQWGAICQLNHLFKSFVFRQEGNLPPPEKLRDEGLLAFQNWDSARYEQNRRHRR